MRTLRGKEKKFNHLKEHPGRCSRKIKSWRMKFSTLSNGLDKMRGQEQRSKIGSSGINVCIGTRANKKAAQVQRKEKLEGIWRRSSGQKSTFFLGSVKIGYFKEID